MLQLVLHYDGAGFSGWQRQPDRRTVQGVVEAAFAQLFDAPTLAVGSGRTDAGVHARGQAVGVRAPERWTAPALHRAMNAILPQDVWVAATMEMREAFHARHSAVARQYSYHVGTDAESASPFRRGTEWSMRRPFDRIALDDAASQITGERCFRGFAVRGTAPVTDDHCCIVREAIWRDQPGGMVFDIEANRFLHHMVRFLVGTMMDVAIGRRPMDDLVKLLVATDNDSVSPPAPPHGLFLEQVRYPSDLYLSEA